MRVTKGSHVMDIYYDELRTKMLVSNTYGTFYYMVNAQGDVTGLVNSSGVRVVEYHYDAWGNLLSTTGASGIGAENPLRYRGYVYDTETGLYYLQSRYYDPEMGRFINADSVVAGENGSVFGYNLFAYCFDNPVNMDDVAGNWTEWLEELGARLANAFKKMGKIAVSPLKAINADIGGGVGIGASGTVNIGGIPLEIGAVTSVADSLTYDKGKFDIQNVTSTNIGITIAEVFGFSYKNGLNHSYLDKNCTCNFISSSYGEKSNCATNHVSTSNDATLGISIGAYLLFGVHASVSIDLIAWNNELIAIFDESLQYGK